MGKKFVLDADSNEFVGEVFTMKITKCEFEEKSMPWDDEDQDYLSIEGDTEFMDGFKIDVRYTTRKSGLL